MEHTTRGKLHDEEVTEDELSSPNQRPPRQKANEQHGMRHGPSPGIRLTVLASQSAPTPATQRSPQRSPRTPSKKKRIIRRRRRNPLPSSPSTTPASLDTEIEEDDAFPDSASSGIRRSITMDSPSLRRTRTSERFSRGHADEFDLESRSEEEIESVDTGDFTDRNSIGGSTHSGGRRPRSRHGSAWDEESDSDTYSSSQRGGGGGASEGQVTEENKEDDDDNDDGSDESDDDFSNLDEEDANLPTKVQVFCRVRPLNNKEKALPGSASTLNCVTVDTTKTAIAVNNPNGTVQYFTLNRIFHTEDNQREVYKHAGDGVVKNFLRGYNGAILAYGQTGSGKTYTMSARSVKEISKGKYRGVIPRAVTSLFTYLRKQEDMVPCHVRPNTGDENADCPSLHAVFGSKPPQGMSDVLVSRDGKRMAMVSVQVVEIYCEKIRDLLSIPKPGSGAHKRASSTKKAIETQRKKDAETEVAEGKVGSTSSVEELGISESYPLMGRSADDFLETLNQYFLEGQQLAEAEGAAKVRSPASKFSSPTASNAAKKKLADSGEVIVRDSKEEGSLLVGAREVLATSETEVFRLMQFAEKRRVTGETDYNERSSRSHMLVILRYRLMDTPLAAASGTVNPGRTARIFLVDLAGSESLKAIQQGRHDSSTRQREMKNINVSLTALRTLISRLAQQSENKGWKGHVGYRDSKLTYVLKPSLSGRTSCAIITTCSPATFNVNETLSTLDFAKGASGITISAEKNKGDNMSDAARLLLLQIGAQREARKKAEEQRKLGTRRRSKAVEDNTDSTSMGSWMTDDSGSRGAPLAGRRRRIRRKPNNFPTASVHTSRGHADIVEEEEEAFRITTFSIRFFLETDSQGKEDEVDPNSKDPSPFGMKLRFERLAEQWPKDALVAEVRPGSLAEVCGVRSNDQIIKIDGIDVRGLKFAAIVRRLRNRGAGVHYITFERRVRIHDNDDYNLSEGEEDLEPPLEETTEDLNSALASEQGSPSPFPNASPRFSSMGSGKKPRMRRGSLGVVPAPNQRKALRRNSMAGVPSRLVVSDVSSDEKPVSRKPFSSRSSGMRSDDEDVAPEIVRSSTLKARKPSAAADDGLESPETTEELVSPVVPPRRLSARHRRASIGAFGGSPKLVVSPSAPTARQVAPEMEEQVTPTRTPRRRLSRRMSQGAISPAVLTGGSGSSASPGWRAGPTPSPLTRKPSALDVEAAKSPLAHVRSPMRTLEKQASAGNVENADRTSRPLRARRASITVTPSSSAKARRNRRGSIGGLPGWT